MKNNKVQFEDDFFKSNDLNEQGKLEKSKRVWVPPSKGKKGYYREDPRGKKVKDKGGDGISVAQDDILTTLEKQTDIKTKEEAIKRVKSLFGKTASDKDIKVAISKMNYGKEKELSTADKDLKVANHYKKDVEKVMDTIEAAFDEIKKEMSEFGSPGFTAAISKAIKSSFEGPTGSSFNSSTAKKVLNKYFEGRK